MLQACDSVHVAVVAEKLERGKITLNLTTPLALNHPTPRGRAGSTHTLVLATGASQRHAHACAEAVRWQILQAAKARLEQEQGAHQPPADGRNTTGSNTTTSTSTSSSGLDSGGGPSRRRAAATLPALSVVGAASSDWVALEAGPLVVHVMTDRARGYFDLESLWGADGKVFAARVAGSEGGVLTKDTIR